MMAAACASPLRHRSEGASGYNAGSNYGGDAGRGYGENGFDHALNHCIENVDGVDDGVCLGSEGGEYDGEKDGERDDAEDVEVGCGFHCEGVGGSLQGLCQCAPIFGGAMLFTTSSKLFEERQGQQEVPCRS
jgi:hypothetical protein